MRRSFFNSAHAELAALTGSAGRRTSGGQQSPPRPSAGWQASSSPRPAAGLVIALCAVSRRSLCDRAGRCRQNPCGFGVERRAAIQSLICMLRAAKRPPVRCSCPEYLRRGHLTALDQDVVRSWRSAAFASERRARHSIKRRRHSYPWARSWGLIAHTDSRCPRDPAPTAARMLGVHTRFPRSGICEGMVREVEKAGIDFVRIA